jgi:threonine dehydratase
LTTLAAAEAVLTPTLTLAEIEAARERIAPHVMRTPIVPMTPAGLGLKAECLQPIGAFKLRGAFNAILSLDAAARARGVIAYSSGNHAQAVAYAARALGAPAVIVMPGDAPRAKLEGTKRWGPQVIETNASSEARRRLAEDLAQERGLALVPPFDARAIMAGQATIGLEILEQAPDVEVVAVPISGGGLASGVAAAIKQSRPQVQVVAVEPELADDAARSFREGRRVRLPAEDATRTIADGLRVQQVGEVTWPTLKAYVDTVITVSEDEIRDAMRRIWAEARLVAEPSGAVAAAGALKGLGARPESVVAVLSGGNVDAAMFAAILSQAS